MAPRLLAFTLLLAANLCAACSYGKMPIDVVAGRRFPVDLARKLDLGSSMEVVRNTLGDPLEISRGAAIETWRYSCSTVGGESIALLGFIPLPPKRYKAAYGATLVFVDSRLTEVKID